VIKDNDRNKFEIWKDLDSSLTITGLEEAMDLVRKEILKWVHCDLMLEE